MKKIFIFALLSIFCTKNAYANILFSEIAWMGSVNSSADEWIEIYNNSESQISIDGYTIESQSKKLLINLSGTIGSKEYFIIERTDDASEPTVKADLISSFGTGLNNSGDTIYLKNEAGQNIDSLLFISGWPAGDNTTKQTMQKLNSSWVTMDKSPKSAPINGTSFVESKKEAEVKVEEEVKDNIKSPTVSSGGAKSEPKIILSRFSVSLVGDQLANVPVELLIDNREENGLPVYPGGVYKINFGDGFEEKYKVGDRVFHAYEYPGIYRITVRYFTNEWSVLPGKQFNLNISVTEPTLVLDTSRAPIIIVKNKTEKDIDLGQFYLLSGSGKKFIFPKDSIVFAGKDLWLSPNITKFTNQETEDLKILSENSNTVIGQTFIASSANNVSSSSLSVKNTNNTSSKKSKVNLQEENIEPPFAVQSFDVSKDSNVLDDKNKNPNKTVVLILFGSLALISALVFFRIRQFEDSEKDEEDFILLDE